MENNLEKEVKIVTAGLANSSSKELQQTEKLEQRSLNRLQDGFEGKVFVPSGDQMRFLRAIFNPRCGSEFMDWIEFAKVSEGQVRIWFDNQDFRDWISGEAEKRSALFKLEWLAIGLRKMHTNVSTWTTMKDIFFSKGIQHSPSEKGSTRYKLEQEIKGLIEKKKSNEK